MTASTRQTRTGATVARTAVKAILPAVGAKIAVRARKRQKPAIPKQTEASFQATILSLAKQFGWRAYHTHNSKRSPAGFPDLVLVRRPRVIFAELKTETGVLSVAQKAWLADLAGCTVESGVWRPSDLEYIVGKLR